jgi:Mrp family chromosome partitioning ATPase
VSIETALNRLKQSGVQPRERPLQAQVSTQRDTAAARLSTLPVAGSISLDALRGDLAGYLPVTPDPQLAEQLRQIKRPLVARALGRSVDRVEQGHVIMITSSVSAEGKTFCSLNLAISMAADRDFDVLLIDADLINPALSTLLRIQDRPGLADAIRKGRDSVLAGVLSTDVPGLFVMGAGSRSGDNVELIDGGRVHEIVAHLGTAYRDLFVVFDSAPLHETSGSRALAGLVGQVVLLVRAGFTPRRIVLETLDLLQGIDPVNVVLNQVTTKQPPTYGSPYGLGASAPPVPLQLETRSNDSDLL